MAVPAALLAFLGLLAVHLRGGKAVDLGDPRARVGLGDVFVADQQRLKDRQVDEPALCVGAGQIWRGAGVDQGQGVFEGPVYLGDLVVSGSR